jgi:hypothetical protein
MRDKIDYYRFLRSLKNVLPCRTCRENYPGNIKRAGVDVSIPPRSVRAYLEANEHFKSRRAFSKMVYRLHKIVAEDVGSTGFRVSYEQLRRNMEALRAKCTRTGCSAPHGGVRCVLRVVDKHDEKRTAATPGGRRREETFRLMMSALPSSPPPPPPL